MHFIRHFIDRYLTYRMKRDVKKFLSMIWIFFPFALFLTPKRENRALTLASVAIWSIVTAVLWQQFSTNCILEHWSIVAFKTWLEDAPDSLKSAIFFSPIAFYLWRFRNQDKTEEIEQSQLDHELKRFGAWYEKLKSESDTDKATAVHAIGQLMLTGRHSENALIFIQQFWNDYWERVELDKRPARSISSRNSEYPEYICVMDLYIRSWLRRMKLPANALGDDWQYAASILEMLYRETEIIDGKRVLRK